MEEFEFLEVKRANYSKYGSIYTPFGGVFGEKRIFSLINAINLKSSVR